MGFGASTGLFAVFVVIVLFRVIPIAFGVWLFFTVQRMRREITALQRRLDVLSRERLPG